MNKEKPIISAFINIEIVISIYYNSIVKPIKIYKEREENKMKTDFTKNETMRKLASVPVVSADSEDGKKIAELVDGLGIAENEKADAYYLAALSFRLGEMSK